MLHNTAIFYDIENLLKGYGSSNNFISSLSLKQIFIQIKKLEPVQEIAVQRAYANWSDPRLSVMKGEINELGIEPIQIFGFSRYQKKNAADIQLAVDAVDLAYVRPKIEVFVIVSGDGGFSCLAKKLHEYGKYVIGCAYQSSTNQIFESVCDIFIGLNEPEIEENEREKSEIETVLKITNPKVLRMSQKIDRLFSKDKKEVIKKSKEIITWFLKDNESLRELETTGIYLSVVKEAFKYGINEFTPSLIGLSKFVQFLQFICCNTNIRVFTSSKCEVKIALQNANIKSFEFLPEIRENYLHSLENYQAILATNSPRLKIPDPKDFKNIVNLVAQLPNIPKTLDGLLEYIDEANLAIDYEIINISLFTLINADVFQREPLESTISEQIFTLKIEYQNPETIMELIRNKIYLKLQNFWGEDFQENIFKELIMGL